MLLFKNIVLIKINRIYEGFIFIQKILKKIVLFSLISISKSLLRHEIKPFNV